MTVLYKEVRDVSDGEMQGTYRVCVALGAMGDYNNNCSNFLCAQLHTCASLVGTTYNFSFLWHSDLSQSTRQLCLLKLLTVRFCYNCVLLFFTQVRVGCTLKNLICWLTVFVLLQYKSTSIFITWIIPVTYLNNTILKLLDL